MRSVLQMLSAIAFLASQAGVVDGQLPQQRAEQELRPGQEWSYRLGDVPAKLVIFKVDSGTGLRPVHVCLRGIRIKNRFTFYRDTALIHLAIAPNVLRLSLDSLLGDTAAVVGCEEGYNEWVAKPELGRVWFGSIAGYITAMENRLAPADSTTRRDPRLCTLARRRDEELDAIARRCAEQFVARNGYTDRPEAVDTAWLAPDSFEWGSVGQSLRRRRRTVRGIADWVECQKEGCRVLFRRIGYPCRLRAVTMTRELADMRIDRYDVMFVPGTREWRDCKAATARASSTTSKKTSKK